MKTLKKIFIRIGLTIAGLLALFIVLALAFADDTTTTEEAPKEPKKEEVVKKEEPKKVEPVEREMNKEAFDGKVKEMIELSGGVIVDIQPLNGDYTHMIVTVSDAWYASPEHEKQRFADTMHENLLVLTRVNGMIELEAEMFMDIEDTFGTEVADYSLFSGMKIK